MFRGREMHFMAPDDGGGAGSAGGQEGDKGNEGKGGQQASGAPKQDELPDDPAQLKALLQKEKEAHQHTISVHTEMKGKYQKREESDAKAREEALKKQGQFESLYNEAAPKLATAEATVKRQEEALSRFLEAELMSLPENVKAIIPEGDAVARLDWISKAKAAGVFGQNKPGAAGQKAGDKSPPPGNAGGVISLDEFNKLTPKERSAYMAKGGKIA